MTGLVEKNYAEALFQVISEEQEDKLKRSEERR